MKRNRHGFTLVELMVVAIIVAILAAVSISIMTANKNRAIATEAEAGCGTIKTALRVYFAEHNAYPNADAGTSATNLPGILSTDLNGTYFSAPCYTFRSDATSYDVTANGANSTAPKAISAQGITVSIDEEGNWTTTGT